MKTPTEKQVEKAIADYLKKHGKGKLCGSCQETHIYHSFYPACELEQALGDYQLSCSLLNEKYFEVITADENKDRTE